MIKVIVCALCSIFAALGASFAAVSYKNGARVAEVKETEAKLETLKTRMISVPVIANEIVKGYVVTRLEIVADAALIKASGVPTESIVADEAFRQIFSSLTSDLVTPLKPKLDPMMQAIVENVNKRLGKNVIKHLLIDSWSMVEVRDETSQNDSTAE